MPETSARDDCRCRPRGSRDGSCFGSRYLRGRGVSTVGPRCVAVAAEASSARMPSWLQPFPADPILIAAGVAGFAALGSFLGAAQARLGAALDGEATYAGRSFWRGRSICPACGEAL